MILAYLYSQLLSLRLQRGEGSSYIMPIIGGLLLLGSYMMYPEVYHGFFRWLFDSVFDALHDSFGTGDQSGAGNGGGKGQK
jgi:hypothetical protein